jgi:mono/diheme cytochrome c family protein
MRPFHATAVVLLAAAALCGGRGARGAEAQKPTGSTLFRQYCTGCHGRHGHGDGALATSLRYAPPDLTLLAHHNKGEFPFDRVRKVIDGRSAVPGHGGPEMPPWGDVLREARDGYDDAVVTAQIDALARHVETLQAKDGER